MFCNSNKDTINNQHTKISLNIKYWKIGLPKKQKRKASKMYCSSQERKELIQEISSNAYILYSYYLEKSGWPYEITDVMAARALGISKRTIQDTRLKLTKYGWISFKTTGGITINHIGKEAVRNQYYDKLMALPVSELDLLMNICEAHKVTDLLEWIEEIL